MQKHLNQKNANVRSPLEIIWHPPGKALPPVKNHWFSWMYKVVGFSIKIL